MYFIISKIKKNSGIICIIMLQKYKVLQILYYH